MDHGSYDEIQEYSASVSSPQSELLHALQRATYIRCIHPRMASGPYQGQVLRMLSTLCAPKRILEIGTYTGYATLCLAEGLREDGELISIEKNDELRSIQEEFFAQSAYYDQIEVKLGSALDILPKLEGKFQLVFLDADKENYLRYLELILPLCDQGCLILIDNMLWEGKVMYEQFDDPQTKSIRDLTQAIAEHEELEQVMLPIRDGLLLARVK